MKYVGAHVSAAGGVENAPVNASLIGAGAFALFIKNQRQWSAPPLTSESIEDFNKNMLFHSFTPDHVLPHDSYLINLGNPDREKRLFSLKSFIDELKRCASLGLNRLNFHPGSHLKLISEGECVKLVAESLNAALDETCKVSCVIENTAGQGGNIGYSFEQIRDIIGMVNDKERVGVCLDTCHAFAAGYDLKSEDGYGIVMEKFEKTIGFDKLLGVHLNDSKGVSGGRLDRHESIGKGMIGTEAFKRIMRDSRFNDIPMVLETPDESLWKSEIELLYSFAGQ